MKASSYQKNQIWSRFERRNSDLGLFADFRPKPPCTKAIKNFSCLNMISVGPTVHDAHSRATTSPKRHTMNKAWPVSAILIPALAKLLKLINTTTGEPS
jgi:hypothetical protein